MKKNLFFIVVLLTVLVMVSISQAQTGHSKIVRVGNDLIIQEIQIVEKARFKNVPISINPDSAIVIMSRGYGELTIHNQVELSTRFALPFTITRTFHQTDTTYSYTSTDGWLPKPHDTKPLSEKNTNYFLWTYLLIPFIGIFLVSIRGVNKKYFPLVYLFFILTPLSQYCFPIQSFPTDLNTLNAWTWFLIISSSLLGIIIFFTVTPVFLIFTTVFAYCFLSIFSRTLLVHDQYYYTLFVIAICLVSYLLSKGIKNWAFPKLKVFLKNLPTKLKKN